MNTLEKLEKFCSHPRHELAKPFLSPDGKETWAVETRAFVRVKEPLAGDRTFTPKQQVELGTVVELMAILEVQIECTSHKFDSKRVADYKAENICPICNGDYSKITKCHRCHGSGKTTCNCCGSAVKCDWCEGAGETDGCTCDHGWAKMAEAFECEVQGTKIYFRPALIDHVVNALGDIEIRLSEYNRGNPLQPAYFTWSDGDGLIASCEV